MKVFKLVMLVAAILFLPSIAWGSITDLSFGQLDWYDENQSILVQNSSWGYMEMDVTADPTNVQYLNVVADAGFGSVWVVENMPLFPTSISSYIRQGVDFNITELGLSEGTSLSSLDYSWSVDSTPATTEGELPAGTSGSAAVSTIERRASGGRLGGTLTADIGAPAGHKARGEVTSVIEHKNVPGVQEDYNDCLPGAFARSLGWLNQKYNLNHPRTPQQIYDDLVGLKIGSHGPGATTYTQDIIAKHGYFRGMASGVTTKILDMSDLIDLGASPPDGLQEVPSQDLLNWILGELTNNEDVEFHYMQGKGSHIVTLTGSYVQDGKTFVKFRDDETQGPEKYTDTNGNGQWDPGEPFVDDNKNGEWDSWDHNKNGKWDLYDNVGDTGEKRALLTPLVFGDGSVAYYFRRLPLDVYDTNFRIEVAISESVPEPATLLLLGFGGLGLLRRRK